MRPLKPVKVHKIKPLKPLKPIKLLKAKKKRAPRTAKTVGTSMAEKEFKLFLNSIGIQVDEQHQLNFKFFDFIIKGTKILIEFQGDYWHANPEVYPKGPINKVQRKAVINDAYKRGLAKMGGYQLIYIWEKEFNEDREGVENKLKMYANAKPMSLDLHDYLKGIVKAAVKVTKKKAAVAKAEVKKATVKKVAPKNKKKTI